jgi:hypothetical protein
MTVQAYRRRGQQEVQWFARFSPGEAGADIAEVACRVDPKAEMRVADFTAGPVLVVRYDGKAANCFLILFPGDYLGTEAGGGLFRATEAALRRYYILADTDAEAAVLAAAEERAAALTGLILAIVADLGIAAEDPGVQATIARRLRLLAAKMREGR